MISTHILKRMVTRDIRDNGELQMSTTLRLVELPTEKLDELVDKFIDEQEDLYRELGEVLRDKTNSLINYVAITEKDISNNKLAIIRLAEIRETVKRIEGKIK